MGTTIAVKTTTRERIEAATIAAAIRGVVAVAAAATAAAVATTTTRRTIAIISATNGTIIVTTSATAADCLAFKLPDRRRRSHRQADDSKCIEKTKMATARKLSCNMAGRLGKTAIEVCADLSSAIDRRLENRSLAADLQTIHTDATGYATAREQSMPSPSRAASQPVVDALNDVAPPQPPPSTTAATSPDRLATRLFDCTIEEPAAIVFKNLELLITNIRTRYGARIVVADVVECIEMGDLRGHLSSRQLVLLIRMLQPHLDVEYGEC